MQAVKLCECGCGEPAPIATRTYPDRGLVKGQPQRYVLGHRARRPGSPDYIIDPDTGCWEWQKALSTGGYATTVQDGRQTYAHRAFFERAKGPIPPGLQIDHLCRNRRCVNPDHLEPVTQAENVRRGALSKLTSADVEAIRTSTEPQRVVAPRFGISPSTVCRIRTGQRRAT